MNKNYPIISKNAQEAIKVFALRIVSAVETLASSRDLITIGLSGGSLIQQLSNELPNYKDKLEPYISKLRFIFCDERFVPLDHDDCTYYGFVKNKLFESLNVPLENVLAINANAKTTEECAQDYENRLKPLLNENNAFDILLLGIGPDGHTCSLFPNHKSFQDAQNTDRICIGVENSPKPPPQRVTLTLKYINNSSFIFFAAMGESKADILKQILVEQDKTLPSANVEATSPGGLLLWFVDQAAAQYLK